MYDAIIISDLHLGSDACQAKQILKLLSLIQSGELCTSKLILNGDVFDSWNFHRLCKQQWKILSVLRKLSDDLRIIWINGNHDGPAEIISHLLGLEVVEEFILISGHVNILILHGHIFDNFIADHPMITFMAGAIYAWMQKVHIYWARYAKKYSKTFLRCSALVADRAREYARKHGCSAVCCGHTHVESVQPGEISYYNSGCWTEPLCHYLTISDGAITLHRFEYENNPSS